MRASNMDHKTHRTASSFSRLTFDSNAFALPITGPIWRGSQDLSPLSPTSTPINCSFIEEVNISYPTGRPSTPSSQTSATTKPPLLHLPKNVREKIYKHALTYAKPVQLQKRCHHRFEVTGYKPSRALRISFNFTPALLRTCCQIQSEATPVFFSSNTFYVSVPDGDLSPLLTWLQETPPSYARLINGLVIKVEPTCIAQVAELAERAADGKGMWDQAVAFADGVSRAGAQVEGVRCLVGECKHMQGDFDGVVSSGMAREMADRWVMELIGVLERIERLEESAGDSSGGLEGLVDGLEGMGIEEVGIGIAH